MNEPLLSKIDGLRRKSFTLITQRRSFSIRGRRIILQSKWTQVIILFTVLFLFWILLVPKLVPSTMTKSTSLFASSDEITEARHELFANLRQDWIVRSYQPTTHQCPKLYPSQTIETRYTKLRNHKFFFAMNLYNNEAVMPELIQQIILSMEYVGYENCFLAIFENGSTDSTKVYLHILKPFLTKARIAHHIEFSKSTKPSNSHRIEYLANVRNRALTAFYDHPQPNIFDRIVFINDIYICQGDILELMYQSLFQQADITCGMDYVERENDVNNPVMFYDTWVMRDMTGKGVVSDRMDNNLNDKRGQSRLPKGLPTQVQCCWNGGAVLNPKPFLEFGVRFRRGVAGECSASECSLLCNDFMSLGYKRVLMVPRVKVAYTEREYNLTLSVRNEMYNSFPSADEEKVSWMEPPTKVFCMSLEGLGRDPDTEPYYEIRSWGEDVKRDGEAL